MANDKTGARGDLALTIHYVRLSRDSCLAVTTLGGITIRGERAPTTFEAIRSLFAGLSGSPSVSSHQDSAIALDLALAGSTITDVATGATLAELAGGNDAAGDDPAT